MAESRPEAVCVACSVFAAELHELRRRGSIDLPIRFVDCDLHTRPRELGERLAEVMGEEEVCRRRVVWVYGDCHPHMIDLESRPGAARTRGANCAEILLGPEAYGERRRAGSFFVLPGWARRSRRVFEEQLGLRSPDAKDMMEEMHSGLLYLDTGQSAVPVAVLDDFSDYCGLPWESVGVALDELLERVREAVDRPGSAEG